jgi:hypothetical protein
MELVGSTYECVIETVDWYAEPYFLIEELLQGFWLYLLDTGRDYNLVAFLCLNLEISRNIEVFHSMISSFLLFLIYEALVPMWVKDELVLLGNLDVEVWIVRVELCLDTSVNLRIIPVDVRVLNHTVLHAAESKERPQLQSRGAVAVE